MTKRVSGGFILPFQQFPQPLLVCSYEYNGLAFGWTHQTGLSSRSCVLMVAN